MLSQRKAFTMIEIMFVIVIIGILSAVAIPKFAANRDTAIVTKARDTVASVRSSIATERQKRILRGDFTPITSLASVTGYNQPIFDAFDGNTSNPVLEYSLRSCKDGSKDGCWVHFGSIYIYKIPISGSATFRLQNNHFNCTSGSICDKLTH